MEIYELDPAHFLSAPALRWQAGLKKTRVKLELLTDIDILLIIEDGIRGGISQSINRYAKTNNKYMKDYNKNKKSSYLRYLDANNLYGWAMCKKLPIINFKWTDDLSKYTENFIRNYDENSDWRGILEVDIEYPKTLWDHQKDLTFLAQKKNKEM